MIGLVVTGHGHFADGIHTSAQMIAVIAGTNLPMIVTAVTMLDMEDDPRRSITAFCGGLAVCTQQKKREQTSRRASAPAWFSPDQALPLLPQTRILLLTYSLTYSRPTALYFFGSKTSGSLARYSFRPLLKAMRRSVA